MKEKSFFENSSGDELCGILSNPTEDGDRPVIILAHGFTSNKDRSTYLRLEKILNEEGVSTFRFDFYGHSESEGKFEDITVSEAVDDVLCAIDFLKNRNYRRIGLFGSSFGGMVSIIAASKTKDLYLLALKSPVSDFYEILLSKKGQEELDRWEKKGFTIYRAADGSKHKLNYSFLRDVKNLDGYEAARNIQIPTLIVHGNEDETVPPQQSKKTADLIEDCKLEIIQGTDHKYSDQKDFEELLKKVSEFIFENS